MANTQYQVFNVDKSNTLLSAAEANENERRWNDRKIDEKNLDPVNNYDKTRMNNNFEIGPDGKIHDLGYQSKTLDQRLKDRLAELNWKPFKEGSKNAPNIFVKMLFSGSPERMNEMAYGDQEINYEKGADNSHIQRRQEIEKWAMDIYRWLCKKYGKENIIGFQVHMDEKTPHIHALIIPVGKRGKSQSDHVMYSAHFGKHRSDYPKIMENLHTELYEEVNNYYGLSRGESCEGRDVHHMDKREAVRELRKLEKKIKSLTTMESNIENQITCLSDQCYNIKQQREAGEVDVEEGRRQLASINEELAKAQKKLQDKQTKLSTMKSEWNELSNNLHGYYIINKPFQMPNLKMSVPKIQGTPPVNPLKHSAWTKEQNEQIANAAKQIVQKVLSDLKPAIDQHVSESHKEIFKAYLKRQDDYFKVSDSLLMANKLNAENNEIISDLLAEMHNPQKSSMVLAVFDALTGGKPIPSSVGGGCDSSDLRWDGRDPKEEEEAFRHRALMHALKLVCHGGQKMNRGYHR